MKQLLALILFISATGFIQAQSLTPKTSYIGINGDVSHYWLYNKKEFNAPDTVFGVKNDSVIANAYAAGISFGHFFNSRFGIEASLNYSTQTQYYGHYPYEWTDSIWWEAHTKLNYLHLPIKILRRTEISDNSFFQYSIGLRLSYLTYAIDHSEYYSTLNIIDTINLIYTFEKNTGGFYSADSDWVIHDDEFMDWRYKRITFGITAGIHYEHFLTNQISVSVGLNLSSDLSNADNHNALRYYRASEPENNNLLARSIWKEYRYGIYDVSYDRPPSHNINVGLQAGIKFWFGENTLNIKVKKGRPLDW